MWLLLLACSGTTPGGKAGSAQPSESTAPSGSESSQADDTATDTGSRIYVESVPPVDTGPSTPPPCAAWGAAVATGVVADATLEEISGVVPSQLNPGVLWVLEDRGGHPAVYAIGTDGTSLGTLTLDGVENLDFESLALTTCAEGWCLWVGDTGDNTRSRPERSIHRIVEPNLLDGSTVLPQTLEPESFLFFYVDVLEDVEGMVVDPTGRPVLFSKDPDGLVRLYAVSTAKPGVAQPVTPLGELQIIDESDSAGGRLVTDASLWPDGRRLLLRTYDSVLELTLADGGLDDIGAATVTELLGAEEEQGEGIGYDPAGAAFYQVSEGINPTIWKVPCLE